MPKVYIFCDMEGISGVSGPEYLERGSPEYEQARGWMAEDAEAQRLKLGGEVADVLWFLTKIANCFGVDMEAQAGSLVERMHAAVPGQYRPQLERGIRHLASDALRAGTRLPGMRTDPPMPDTTG